MPAQIDRPLDPAERFFWLSDCVSRSDVVKLPPVEAAKTATGLRDHLVAEAGASLPS
ncbi:MAG TPA: hypothetical protein VLD36_04870 [Burkholderiales bacterium]|jgi:hypothetical protein|nr:hypothetical protein [Burkholderiales bacterium]